MRAASRAGNAAANTVTAARSNAIPPATAGSQTVVPYNTLDKGDATTISRTMPTAEPAAAYCAD